MLDKVTEMVAHMIGIFQITVEEERLRDDYLKIKALRSDAPQTDPLAGDPAQFKAAYQLGDFAPTLRLLKSLPDAPHPVPEAAPAFPQFPPAPFFPAPEPGPPEVEVAMMMTGIGGARMALMLEPPGSVVIVTWQYNHLIDNDLLLLGESAAVFVDPAFHMAQLQGWLELAQAVTPIFGDGLPPLEESAHDYALGLHQQIQETGDPGLTGLTVTIQTGAAAYGTYENGERVETALKLDDVMPAFLSPDSAEEDATDPTGEPAWSPGPFKGLDGGPDMHSSEPGHAVVAGANLVVNQVNIATGWLDAPVIAVMGDVIHLNLISQTNMLVEQGQFGGAGAASPSAAWNSATMALQASAPALEGDAAAPSAAALALPSNWVVTRIDGDLLMVNHVQQYSFMTDFDRADIVFHSAETYIGLGDNTVINLTDLVEIGYGYDLILIGGHMITVNQISQLNVLIDTNTVTYSGVQPGDFSAGDNLVFNGASITGTGIDSYQPMQDNFARAAEELAAGGRSIDESVAHDSVFEGVDVLRVLYISGDATTINRVDQTNVLGDSDQVHLALDNFQSATGADVTLTAGSNAAINLASISQYGVDSTVSVGGEVYDDALLYQAGLIDTDADPTGVDLPALASEAVAFLAEDMVGPETAMEQMGIAPTAPEDTSTPDMMQTMLA
ncbi:type I secretion protein ATPase [Pontibaca salina]|uniref:Type I secretion protein ATPase n=1 Tax=Pontibaca salina TaxID=2795731 RepID=A0A934HTL3_9RHOB|nr:type I secretion protein ATPase [Pontibaca salina]MBI6630606.1 type I secretion protein ATPase [Pontibaca salina]